MAPTELFNLRTEENIVESHHVLVVDKKIPMEFTRVILNFFFGTIEHLSLENFKAQCHLVILFRGYTQENPRKKYSIFSALFLGL